jgi:hypothetical protein
LASGLKNGDTAAQAISTAATVAVAGSTSTSGNYTAENHTLTPSGAAGGLGYAFGYVNGTLAVNQKDLTVTGITASDKVYNANTTAAINTGSAVITNGAAAADDKKYYTGDIIVLDVSTPSGAFADKNVATNLTVTVSGLSLTGEDAGNYTIADASNAKANITPAPLTVTANNAAKTYSQTVTFAGTEFTSSGLVANEAIGLVQLASLGSPATADTAGSPYAIVASDASGGTFSAANYAISYKSGILTITAPDNTVYKDQTDNQNSVNGAEQGTGGKPGTPHTPSMGPGAGSGNVVAPSVVTTPATTGAVLTTSTFSAPVTLSTTGQTMTLTVVGATASGPMVEVGALPVFTQSGGAPPALQGNFVVHQSGSAVSLTPASPTGPSAAPPTTNLTGEKSAIFTLTLENGMTLQMTASVTQNGVLVVSAPDAAGSIDVQQAILMGAQVAKQSLQVELSSLSSALFVRQ